MIFHSLYLILSPSFCLTVVFATVGHYCLPLPPAATLTTEYSNS